MNPGQIVEAEVTAVEAYGVYLTCEGRKILVLVPELTWIPAVQDGREFTAPGRKHTLRLLRFVPDKEIFMGSFKQAHPEQDPWHNAGRFVLGSVRPGTVTHLVHRGEQKTLCGRIVELEPGVAGFLPVLANSGELPVGAAIRVKIVRVDAAAQKIELVAAE